MPSRRSALARSLEPLAAGLWTLFLIVSALVAVIWSGGIGDASLTQWIRPGGLLRALLWLLDHLDFAWITLAAANVYGCVASRAGLSQARRSSLIILSAVITFGWLSARTGFPLGPIEFGRPLGMKIGPVPVGLAFFWLAAIFGAREGLMLLLPRWSHLQIALGSGLIGVLTDLNLEPVATKLRGFWFWRAAIPGEPPTFDFPLSGSLAWGFLAMLLTFSLRERDVVKSARKYSWKPAFTLVIIHAVCLAAHLGRWVRG